MRLRGWSEVCAERARPIVGERISSSCSWGAAKNGLGAQGVPCGYGIVEDRINAEVEMWGRLPDALLRRRDLWR